MPSTRLPFCRRSGLLFLLVISASVARAQDPETYRQQANADVRAASEILTQAEKIMVGEITRPKAEVGMELYMRAGKLFEKAAIVYENLGAQYSRPEDAANARQAMDLCMNRMKEIKQRLR